MITSLTAVAQQIPAYCATGHVSRTPAQFQACLKAGWQMPTNGAANLGHAVGHGGAPVLLVVLIAAAVLWVASRLARSGSTATS
jgi:hypothetical protein